MKVYGYFEDIPGNLQTEKAVSLPALKTGTYRIKILVNRVTAVPSLFVFTYIFILNVSVPRLSFCMPIKHHTKGALKAG
jgi:hypothetical protein